MAFEAPIVTLAWLATFTLPDRTLRFCDGGQVKWGDDMYRASDDDFGTISEVEEPDEQTGDEAPGATITFLPVSTAAAATLSQPAYQFSPVDFWLAEVDPATGEAIGDPEPMAAMDLDTTTLILGKGTRKLEMGLVSACDRLFLNDEGNSLNTAFHQRVWPGELGLDNATGKPGTVAWGVTAPPAGTVVTGAGSGGGGGLFNQAAF